jgi:tripartite-type tricarboxylate transporter receptor subunit TctC
MGLVRRHFLRGAAGVLALPIASRLARAEAYPTRPVHLIVGYAPGGPTDIVARLIGQDLSARLGQQFVIENRPGAGNNIAAEIVAKARADGYILLLATVANAINATLYDKLNFNFISDIAPVASVVRLPLVLEVNPSLPAKTVPEFIAYAKANPGKINYASPGNGSPQHLAAELFKTMAGVNLVHVPYRGVAPALIDLIGGQVQAMFDTTPASLAHIKAGEIRPLGVTTTVRVEALRDIPPIAEFLAGYEATSWFGIGAPKSTPDEIIKKLNAEINVSLADPTMETRLADIGGTPLPGSPADFRKLIADETDKLGKVVKISGAKPD